MSYEIKGELIKKFDTETFASGFQKRSIVVRTEESYPQEILVEFTKDRIDLIDAHNVGDMVTVGFNLNGRKWESPQGDEKWFNSIVGWRITAGTMAPNQQNATHREAVRNAVEKNLNPFGDEEDDLQF